MGANSNEERGLPVNRSCWRQAARLSIALIVSGILCPSSEAGKPNCQTPLFVPPTPVPGSCACAGGACPGQVIIITRGYTYCTRASAGVADCPAIPHVAVGTIQDCSQSVDVGAMAACAAGCAGCVVLCDACVAAPTPACALACTACVSACTACMTNPCTGVACTGSAVRILYRDDHSTSGSCP